jgi:ribA/ribD-fused uncharacterized protein
MKINRFADQFGWLSNFHPAAITLNEKIWPSVEHFYQAMKSPFPIEQELIRGAATGGRAKRLGREITLRDNWETLKVNFMLVALAAKFNQHEILKLKLMNTHAAELIEGNYWHDNYWGECHCRRCEKREKKNMLGKMLMQLRTIYLSTSKEVL